MELDSIIQHPAPQEYEYMMDSTDPRTDIAELKFWDTAIGDAVVTAGATYGITRIEQGISESTRTGRLIRVRSIQLRGLVHFDPGLQLKPLSLFYLYLIIDHQSNGVNNPVYSDVFLDTGGVGPHIQFTELNNASRFSIIKRWVISFQTSGMNVVDDINVMYGRFQQLEYYTPMDLDIHYGYDPAIPQTLKNNVFVAYSSINDDCVTIALQARVRFIDLD